MIHIFDTHAHYDDEAFDEDRDELLKLKDTVIADVTKQISTDTTELLSTEIADLNGYISNQIEVVLANLKK